MRTINVGLIGSQFVSDIHATSLQSVPGAKILAAASPTEEHITAFARRFDIPHAYTDYHKLLEMPEIDMVVIGAPNYAHAEIAIAAAQAGKAIVLEKPMALNLQEADAMLAAAKQANVKLMYAEELCFTPKYVRLKQLADSGALGDIYLVKQSEKHDGPHAPWFWDVEKSGGGVTMDMGCHACTFFLWFYDWAKPESILADMGTHVHADKTQGDDNATIVVTFPGGRKGLAEESWARKGGMDDRAEAYGSKGCSYAYLHMGIALQTYSEVGYDYVVEKAPVSTGWSYTIYEELWNYGFPQEFQHFVECVRDDKEPLVTGEHARTTLEMIFAAYASAGRNARVSFPLQTDARLPIDLWKPNR
ncbi:MAG TPA: Gfo/Idh/MocA family oxidoreductase [Chthonomonadaceae bacterium]|nr:Gfo/Idh/MocA family oxidoreductase [Chthonomonadaceae bacterium]